MRNSLVQKLMTVGTAGAPGWGTSPRKRQSAESWAELIATSRRPDFTAIPLDQLEDVLKALCEKNSVSDHFVEYLLRYSGVLLSTLTFRGAYNLRKASLNLIPQYALDIVSLNLSKCRQIENKLVQGLMERCSYLEHLCLDGCVKISDSAFNSLRFLPLRKLSLSGLTQISPVSLNRLLLVLDRLESIDLSNCRAAVDASVLWSIFDAAQTDRLRHVDVSNTAVLAADFAFLEYPGQHVPLVSLVLAGSQGNPARFSDATLLSLARRCGSTLVEISLAWNSTVTDAGVAALAASSGRRLLRLNLCNTRVTSETLVSLARHCENLEQLNLAWCTAVDGEGLEFLTSKLRHLVAVDCAHCTDYLRDHQFHWEHAVQTARNFRFSSIQTLNLLGTSALTCSAEALRMIGNLPLHSLALNVARSVETVLAGTLANFSLLKELSLDLSECSSSVSLASLVSGSGVLANLECIRISASEASPVDDAFLTALFDGDGDSSSRKALRLVELQNCAGISDELFPSWLTSPVDPEQEAMDYVDYLIDRQLARRKFPATVAAHTQISSDSDATVLHRPTSRNLRRPRGKSFGLTSGSEAENAFYRPRFPGGCPSVTSQGAAMQRLAAFSVSGAAQLTDKSVLAVSRLLPWVQTLELRDVCRSVQEETVEEVRRNCRALRKLVLSTAKLRIRFDTSRSFTRKTRRDQASARRPSSSSQTEDD